MVTEWKIKEVEKLKNELKRWPVIGVVDVGNIPARQLQRIRSELTGQALLRISKKSLMNIALNEVSKGNDHIKELSDYMKGRPGFIFTNMSPFKLYRVIQKNKTTASAKVGQVAPNDIVVPKGETPFPPGPILGEFQRAGLPIEIQKGKIVITEDTVVLKKGMKVTPLIANVLNRLGIEPMEVGLDLLAVYEDGSILAPEHLHVDTEEIVAKIRDCFSSGLNLSINACIPTRYTTEILLKNAFLNARNLSLNAGIPTKETMGTMISNVYLRALNLVSFLASKKPDALPDHLKSILTRKEVSKEEKKVEEKKVEKEEEDKVASGLSALFG
ncbi:MAG: 50S ribosomal protein L10 [Candidatus Hydrothermarchaeota archaeon]